MKLLKNPLLSLTLMLLFWAPLRSQVTLEDAVDLLGQYRVSRLDSLLPRTPFLTWFKSVVGNSAKLEWEINDCGEQTGDATLDADRDFPSCIEVTATLPDQRKVGVAVAVGTVKKGLSGLPTVTSVYLEIGGQFYHLKRLSELPKAVTASEKR